MPADSIPYPLAPVGWERDISLSLQQGRLPPPAANGWLADGAPWDLVARHVTDRAWWQTQRRRPTSHLQRSWRMASWGATLHLETEEISIWVDPGPADYSLPNREPDLVLVTHAHFDHVARLGALVARWPDTIIVMTAETAQLLAARDQDGSLRAALQRTALLAFDSPRQLNGIGVRLWPAGHVLGAAMIELDVAGDRVLITGDFALRDVGGLRGADPPTGDYGLVLMESTQADWRTLPVAHEAATRRPLLQQLAQSWYADCPLMIQANSLGQVQEAYAAVIMAQRAGAWPEAQHKVQVIGTAADICQQYHAALSECSPVWRYSPYAISSHEVPAGVLVLTGSSQTVLDHEPWLTCAGQYLQTLPRPEIYTHAGWAERLTLAFGTACGQICLYAGTTPDLRLFLSECGFDVLPHLTEGTPWTNRL